MNKKSKIIIFVVMIVVIGISYKIMSSYNKKDINMIEYYNINIDTGEKKTFESELIPLNIGETEDIIGGQLLHINDYKILIKQELVEIGYDTSIEDNVLTISSKDNAYKCTVLQLSDTYVKPTEEEIEAFFETEEYKKWDEEEYDSYDEEAFDKYMEKYDEIYANYYKNLGYTVKNSPNYVLTEKEIFNIIEKFMLKGEKSSSGRSGLFPGDEFYNNYDWGKTTLYAIPKYYKDKTFGEKTSDMSVCIYFIEHYDVNEESYVSLWTL